MLLVVKQFPNLNTVWRSLSSYIRDQLQINSNAKPWYFLPGVRFFEQILLNSVCARVGHCWHEYSIPTLQVSELYHWERHFWMIAVVVHTFYTFSGKTAAAPRECQQGTLRTVRGTCWPPTYHCCCSEQVWRMTSWRVHGNSEIKILPCWHVFLGLCYVMFREYGIYDIKARNCNKCINSFPGVTRDVLVLFLYYVHLPHMEFIFDRDRWRALVNAAMNLRIP